MSSRLISVALLVAAVVLGPATAYATPSTTFWAPSTASCQARGLPHVTYDMYFRKGPAAESTGAPSYPVDTGLTVGFLPLSRMQGEAGFDVLLPSPDPLFVNIKLCTPESAWFSGSPGVSLGMYNVGFKKGISDYDVLHLMVQKSLATGGYVSVGVYHALSRTVFTNSDGETSRTGAILGVASPDIQVNRRGLRKITLAADLQTGRNALGAWGFGSYVYFADNVSLLVGPVFFFDKNLQPGGSKYMWSVQPDVDIPLGR